MKTIIPIGKGNIEIVEEICQMIGNKDKTFQYNIEHKAYENFLVIYSQDKNLAHKRGLIFTKKYLPQHQIDTYYKVEE